MKLHRRQFLGASLAASASGVLSSTARLQVSGLDQPFGVLFAHLVRRSVADQTRSAAAMFR